jgi:protease-4
MTKKGKIAIIPIKGMVISEEAPASPFPLFAMARVVSSAEVIPLVESVKKNRKIKGLILEINSPGGRPFPCKEIAEAIKNVGKPTVAWIREYAASGGYWIASSCDTIVADGLSTLGSIGVASIRPDFSELMKKFGIDIETMASGIYKTFGIPYKKSTPEEKELLKEELDIIYKNFIEEVTKNRKLNEEVVNEISTGKIYLGEEAKKLGLVDFLGGKDKAIELIKEKAGIEAYKIVDYAKKMRRPLGFLRRMFGSIYECG